MVGFLWAVYFLWRHDWPWALGVVLASVLRFGLSLPAHGSFDMPVWGPIFQQLDNYNEAAMRQRIERLCAFLESIQEK
jgi:hypothetical protein